MDDERQPSPEHESRGQDAGRSEPARNQDPRVEPTTAFEELGKLVLGEQSMTAVLERVAALAKAVIPDVREASVTLMRDKGDAETVVFTGSLAYQLDERQYTAGFGPCMDAAVAGRTIRIDNADPEGPYPEFSRVSLRSGVTHSLSVGLPVPQRIVGALNLYAAGNEPFDHETVELAETFGGYAAVAIANAALYSSTAGLAAHLQTAMQSRAVIEQAKGIIMGRNRCSAEEAFTLLTTMSQRRNEKVRDLAQEIVDSITSA